MKSPCFLPRTQRLSQSSSTGAKVANGKIVNHSKSLYGLPGRKLKTTKNVISKTNDPSSPSTIYTNAFNTVQTMPPSLSRQVARRPWRCALRTVGQWHDNSIQNAADNGPSQK